MRAERRDRYKPISIEAQTLLEEGRPVEAVKALRHSEDIGTREARARIDAHIADHPLLRVQLETRRREARRKFFLWFFLVDALAVAAFIYWYSQRP